jgi:hypothetical protein
MNEDPRLQLLYFTFHIEMSLLRYEFLISVVIVIVSR